MQSDNLLVEIGSEELPPKSLNQLRTSFLRSIEDELSKAAFKFTAIQAFATPRRLAVLIENLTEYQQDQHIERRGPATKAAWDKDGSPTKALLGFAKSVGVTDLSELTTTQTTKGEWVIYSASKKGQSIDNLLPAIVQTALNALPIDRRMRWGKNRFEFVRPVKWITALYGKSIIPLELFGLAAGRTSQGHRFLSKGKFTLADANDYLEACRDNHVIVRFEERKETIRSQLIAKALELNADLSIDESLLDEVTSIVEWPVALAGSFEAAFLSVPPEVLISAMKEHQRYFHLTQNGALLPMFITVANIISKDESAIITGNERVIRPRLADATFFYEQDKKVSFDAYLERLEKVVFQTDLGTYKAKSIRISNLAAFIATELGLDSVLAARAGLLCKADLVTDLVGEFPDLQGVMGGYYAAAAGEAESVVTAIKEHYRPTQSGGELPSPKIASCIALADKIDTLVGLFGINQPPTGSRDPYALRRQALGVVRICIDNELDLDLYRCLEQSASLFATESRKGTPFEVDVVFNYIFDRLSNWYVETGISADIVDAVRRGNHGAQNLFVTSKRVVTLKQFRGEPVAEKIIAANKRVANLLKKMAANDHLEARGRQPEIDAQLLVEPAETALAATLRKARAAMSTEENVSQQLIILAELQSDVDIFFDNVHVMAEDASLQANRLGLLAGVRELFLEVADFSVLQ